MMSPRLEIDNLICARGERALFGALTFALEGGEVARVLGANGSGKTTLLRTVAGLYRPLSGTVRWQPAQRDNTDVPQLRDQLCFVGHDNALCGALTPIENLDMLMRVAGRPITSAAIRATLADLGLKRVAHRPCERLSAGQRRRVSLARLWLSDASVWLLDEPASALDVDARAALSEHIAAHVTRGGMVLFTTHESLALAGLTPRPIELAPC